MPNKNRSAVILPKPLDLTTVRPHGDYPLIQVSEPG
jgi:hypothetical protein